MRNESQAPTNCPVMYCLFDGEQGPLLRKPREGTGPEPPRARETGGRGRGRSPREREGAEGGKERGRKKESEKEREREKGEREAGRQEGASTQRGKRGEREHRSAPRTNDQRRTPEHTRRDPHDPPGPARHQRSPLRP